MIGNAVLLRRRRGLDVAISSSLHRRARTPPESIQFVTFVLLHHRARIPQKWEQVLRYECAQGFRFEALPYR
jgi:hypothetical protein